MVLELLFSPSPKSQLVVLLPLRLLVAVSREIRRSLEPRLVLGCLGLKHGNCNQDKHRVGLWTLHMSTRESWG